MGLRLYRGGIRKWNIAYNGDSNTGNNQSNVFQYTLSYVS